MAFRNRSILAAARRTAAFVLSAALVVSVLLCGAGSARATPLGDARESFEGADFEMALRILDDYLAKGAAGPDRIEALTVAAQCHERLGNEDAAVRNLCEVLKLDPDWQPDPNRFSPQEMRTYRLALASCPPKRSAPKPPTVAPTSAAPPPASEGPRWYERKVVWVGVGAAALTAVLLSGGKDSGPGNPGNTSGVPGFPDPPSVPHYAWRW
ncbi:MAG: hypothetical protein U0167_12635 [bacterium]